MPMSLTERANVIAKEAMNKADWCATRPVGLREETYDAVYELALKHLSEVMAGMGRIS